MPVNKIMIVDDERLVRWSLRQKCEEWGYQVVEADAGEAGLKLAQRESPDLVLLDVRMPDLTGIEVLDQLKKNGDARAVIMITADPQLDDVKAALKLGAYDFVGKPIDFDELHVAIKNALEATSLRTEVQTLRSEVRRTSGYSNVVSVSPKMTELMNFVRKVAASEATTVLIQGESGTGKDLIAKAIHYESSRQEKPFVAINCSAIPETLMEAELFGHEKGAFTDAKQMKKGLFEAADGGTLFLDELGTLAAPGQAKLLRVLQTGEFERLGSNSTRRTRVRVIAATNTNLRQAIRAGAFREDLFYRLNVIELEVPALAERRVDIVPLARHFLQPGFQLTPEAAEALTRYPWPGNVRELQNAIRRACLLSSERAIGVPALNLPAVPPATAEEPGLDRASVEQALGRAGGVIAHAARDLGLSRQALYRRMEKLGLRTEPSRSPSAP
jgi:DNA-binding NtrC family response regulator